MPIKIIELEIQDYEEVYALQKKISEAQIERRLNGLKTENTLILCEHPHVYTIGKSGQAGNLLVDEAFLKQKAAKCLRSDRGGDITYHGPGQLVGYPIFDLEALNLGVRQYIIKLEKMLMRVAEHYGIRTQIREDAVGLWIEKKGKLEKLAALGVRINRMISMHGFAMNVTTDLRYFDYINPCGFTDRGATSLQKETGKKIPMKEVRKQVIEEIKTAFAS